MTLQVSLYANHIEALSAGDIAPQTANGLPVVNHGESLAPYVQAEGSGVKVRARHLGGGSSAPFHRQAARVRGR